MSEPPPQRFTFVNFTTPAEAKQRDARKRIRSAAAYSAWDKRFKKRLEREAGPIEEDQEAEKADESGHDRPSLAPKIPSSSSEHSSGSGSQSYAQHHLPDLSTPVHDQSGLAPPSLAQQTSSLLSEQAWAAESQLYEQHYLPELIKQRHDSSLGMPAQLNLSEASRISEAWLPQHQYMDVATAPQANMRARTCTDCARRQCKRHIPAKTDSTLVKRELKRSSRQKTTSVQQAKAARLMSLLESAPPPGRIAAGKLDPFNSYPVPAEPWFDWALHHMLTVFAPRGWPTLGITPTQGRSWESFMTSHALCEPALFYVRLLFATGDLVRLHLVPPTTSLWLRTRAVQAINSALNDPARSTSDALILAVGRIALHESMYGDRIAASAIHRPAQHRMITMRGGMSALGFPELVKRLMRWSDRVMSMQSGTPRYIVEEDDENYTLEQSVEVLERWVPQEGMALRQKFRQTDRRASGLDGAGRGAAVE